MSEGRFDTINGRHVIESGTPVINGVLLTKTSLVFDFEEQPDVYEKIYERIVASLPDGSVESPFDTVKAVGAVVTEAVEYDEDIKRKVLRDIATERGLQRRLGVSDETFLSESVKAGGGVCHDQSLVAAGMLQLLGERRGLIGETSLERRGIHSSVRYTTPGQRIIMDLSEGKIMLLDGLRRREAHPYLRPKERMDSLFLGVGKANLQQHQAAT